MEDEPSRRSETDAPAFDLPAFAHTDLLSIADLSPRDIVHLLDRADTMVDIPRNRETTSRRFAGRTQINLFYENSTRTQSSFELAGKRLGADVMNMAVASSSVKKGETLIDTAMTLNEMRPEFVVMSVV